MTTSLAVDEPIPPLRHAGASSTLARNAVAFGAVLVVALGLHFLFALLDLPYPSKLCIDVLIAVTLSVSLTMVNGYTGQFSIGHAGFMLLGGYAAAAVTYYGSLKLFGSAAAEGGVLSHGLALTFFNGPLFGRGELLFVGAALFGGFVAALAGFVVGLPSLRLRGDYLAIVTLGFGEIVRVLVEATGEQPSAYTAAQAKAVAELPTLSLVTKLGGPLGFNNAPPYTTIFWAALVAALTVLVALRLKYSSLGRAYLSIREDEVAAASVGVALTRYKVQAFTLAAFFAGLAGALYAHQVPIRAADLGFMRSFEVIIVVVLGGLGSVSGAVLASVVLTLLPEALRDANQYRIVIYALLLIGMMLVRPQGLLGTREVWELWRGKR